MIGGGKVVDFAKFREQNKARLAADKDKPMRIAPKQPTFYDRLQHLVNHHTGEMTEWEVNFCWNNINFLSNDHDKYLSGRVQEKVKELEDMYCGTMCHALNDAGIPHS